MNPNKLFQQKKAVAKATLETKVKISGLCCSVEIPKAFIEEDDTKYPVSPFQNIYGEESGHIEYIPVDKPNRVLIVNSTQETMRANSKLQNSTENDNLYLLMFEDDILPRDSRIKVFMEDGSYKQLQVRDNITTCAYVVRQELVPCINKTIKNDTIKIGENL